MAPRGFLCRWRVLALAVVVALLSTGTASAQTEAELSEDTPLTRCGRNQVDLAPEQDEPKCVRHRQLNRLLTAFDAAAAEEAAALEELAGTLESLASLNDQLDQLHSRLGEVRLSLAGAKVDARFAQIRESIAGEGLDDATATLALEEGRLRAQAVDAYVGGNAAKAAASSALPQLGSYSQRQTAQEYAAAVLDKQVSTIQTVAALRGAVDTLATVVGEIESDAQAEAVRVDIIQRRVDEFIVAVRGLVLEAERDAEAIAVQIAEIQIRKKVYAEELRLTGVGAGSIGLLLADLQVGQEDPGSTVGLLSVPLDNARFGSGYGPRVHPIFDDKRLHTGLDISASAGAAVLASAPGVVVYAAETLGYGNVVVVDHGNTMATLYAHLAADSVDVNQQVVEGEVLGFVGSTGYSTSPHLHYEVRLNGQPVDPAPFLREG